MTAFEADREMGDIISRRLTGQERPEDAARLAYLQSWRRNNLFPISRNNRSKKA